METEPRQAKGSVNALTPAERRALRARAHHLQPVVMIGEAGLTPQVLKEIEASLKSHELIKVRVLGDDRTVREALIAEISRATQASPVQQIGKMLVFYRPRPQDEAQPRTRRPQRKPARRTKRSYQG